MAVPVVNKSLFIVGHGPPVLAPGGQSAKLGEQLAGGLGRGATCQSLRVGVDGAALQQSSVADEFFRAPPHLVLDVILSFGCKCITRESVRKTGEEGEYMTAGAVSSSR